MHDVSCKVSNINHCCGVREIGEMGTSHPYYADHKASGATLAEAYKNLLTDVLEGQMSRDEDDDDDDDGDESNRGYMMQVWFVCHRNSDDEFPGTYQAEELRQLVRSIKGVTHLGTIINPNSGNRIDGYSWHNEGVEFV